MTQQLPTRRTTSLSGTSRLSLSVSNKPAPPAPLTAAGRHPLRQNWSISYVHRPPGTKVDYEKEIHKVATFGSIESFLHLYTHLTPPSELAPVTDILCFASRIQRPGIWEEMVNGGKFTIRLLHPVTNVLYESLLFSLIGDQFDEADNVVGCVLSVRQTEDILSVWVEEEGDGVRSGALREKILSLLSLPSSTLCEYRSNRALLDAASSLKDKLATDGQHGDGAHGGHHGHSHHGGHVAGHQHHTAHHASAQGGFHGQHHGRHQHHERGTHFRERDSTRGPRSDDQSAAPGSGAPAERRTGWGNGFRREQ